MKTSKGSKLKSKLADAGNDKSLKTTAKAIMEQAEQIWLAGLGAFAKAQGLRNAGQGRRGAGKGDSQTHRLQGRGSTRHG